MLENVQITLKKDLNKIIIEEFGQGNYLQAHFLTIFTNSSNKSTEIKIIGSIPIKVEILTTVVDKFKISSQHYYASLTIIMQKTIRNNNSRSKSNK